VGCPTAGSVSGPHERHALRMEWDHDRRPLLLPGGAPRQPCPHQVGRGLARPEADPGAAHRSDRPLAGAAAASSRTVRLLHSQLHRHRRGDRRDRRPALRVGDLVARSGAARHQLRGLRPSAPPVGARRPDAGPRPARPHRSGTRTARRSRRSQVRQSCRHEPGRAAASHFGRLGEVSARVLGERRAT
jgi:hypothetical protein